MANYNKKTRLNSNQFDLCTYLLFRESWVNDKHYTINSERGLSNVCGDHHLATNSSVRFVRRC